MEDSYLRTDTIAAIATSPNVVSAIGIIRISGSRCLDVAEALFRPRTKKISSASGKLDRANLDPHRMYRGDFLDRKGEPLDDGLLVYMPNPNSFTGEDSCEFQLHGNPLILGRMMEAILATGFAKAAAPGEFSFRAFRSGKLDLSQAEAVSDLIASKTPVAMKRALSSLQGRVRRSIETLKEDLISILAAVELDIDFSDQGVSVIRYPEILERVKKLRAALEHSLRSYERSVPLQQGIRTVIIGAPNAGKSTLFNHFVGSDRSIVSDIAGTTRDVVREQVLFGDLLFLISDTAGLRESSDVIEREGIRRSRSELGEANLILHLVDAGDKKNLQASTIEDTHAEIRADGTNATIVLVINKKDLLSKNEIQKYSEELKRFEPIYISAKEAEGVEGLEEHIRSKLYFEQEDSGSLVIDRARHADLVRSAVESLAASEINLEQGEAVADLIAVDLRSALDRLGDITGDVSRDDLLNVIFSRFCIGK